MLRKLLFALIFIVGIVIAFVFIKSNSILSKEGQYTYEQFSKEPSGKEEYISTPDGSKIRVIRAGTGKTVILAHGFGGTIRDWNLVYGQLIQSGYHVIAFEQRGHNKSIEGEEGIGSKQMASDYKAILEYFDVKEGVLVGHSMGGFLAIKFMIENPEVVKKHLKSCLIMSSFAGDISRDNEQNKMQIPLIEKGYINTIFNTKPLATIFSSTLIGEPYGAIIKTSLDNFKLQNYKKLVPILKAFVDENYYDKLSSIPIPSTILVGSADKTAPAFHSENLSKGIKGAKLVKLEGKGHLLNWESPEAVCKEIIALHNLK